MSRPYVVKRNELYCTWEEDISILDKNTVVLAGEGTQIIHYVNGTVEKNYYTTDNNKKKWLVVNTGKMLKNGDEAVVGVNDGKEFTILWGVGGVPYVDKSGLETQVGMNGEYKFKIQQHPKLIRALGSNDVMPKDVKDFTDAKLQETLKTQLAKKLKGKDYNDVVTMQSELSDDIKYAYEQELETLGIKLTSFSLKEIFFPDDYVEAHGQNRDSDPTGIKTYIKNREDAERRQREDEEAAKILASLKASSGAVNPPQDNPAGNGGVNLSHFCPRCGKEVAHDAVFCDRCGSKLQ